MPHNMIYELDLDDTLKDILDRLPARQRDCFILHYAYGYKYKEIAEKLEIGVGTVHTHIVRAISSINVYTKTT